MASDVKKTKAEAVPKKEAAQADRPPRGPVSHRGFPSRRFVRVQAGVTTMTICFASGPVNGASARRRKV